jgi:hypothetical protein
MEGIWPSGGDNKQAKSKESRTRATVNHRKGREKEGKATRTEKQSNHSIVRLPRNRVLEGGDGRAEEILATPRLDKRWDGVAPQRVKGIEPKRHSRTIVVCLTDDRVQADRFVFCRWEAVTLVHQLNPVKTPRRTHVGLLAHWLCWNRKPSPIWD